MSEIKKIETEGHELDVVRNLFKEYAYELNEDLCFQSFNEELQYPLKKYHSPEGGVFMALHNHEPAGCIAFQPVGTEKVCEMKRLYVKPGFRKAGIGNELVQTVLNAAASAGYVKMVLDTLERLQPAILLYRRYGFINTSAYYSNPLPGVVYMEKVL